MISNHEYIVIEIAGIVFSVSTSLPRGAVRIEKSFREFLSTKKPEIHLHASYEGLPQISLRNKDKIFDSEIAWSYYRRTSGENIFVLHPPVDGPLPRRMAILDADLLHGEVYSRIPDSTRLTDGLLPSPFGYPLFEILMICLLSRGRGLMVHACGVDDGGKGYLFAGNSSHGKTTMARLWEDHGTVLNDDRIILRQCNERFFMFGTPFHGEYPHVSSRGVPLEKIFFLGHAEANNIQRRNDAVACSMILTRSFLPFWDAKDMGYTLDFTSQLVTAVPCYALDFVPNHNIVDFIQCAR